MNYEYKGRSSYFKVKDLEVLNKWADSTGCVHVEKGDSGTFCLMTEYAIGNEDMEGNPIPSMSEAAKEFLEEGEVVVFAYQYNEGFRYVGGGSLSFDGQGVICSIDSNDIYEATAKKLNLHVDNIPKAEY
jgi:hypothetical protein